MEFVARMILLLMLLTTSSKTVESTCVLTDEETTPCKGALYCSDDFDGAAAVVREWSCRRQGYYADYDYYHRRQRVRLSDDYTLSVHVNNIGDSASFSEVGPTADMSSHITSISMFNGNISLIPTEIRSLRIAHTINLSRNCIQNLNLELFRGNNLLVLNVSFNDISILENEGFPLQTTVRPLTTLDLSNNAIHAIPNNYFRSFSQLQHLNLSHNSIESIDILTFEGLAQLRSLYMSNNKLLNIGQYFARFVNLQELKLDNNYLTEIERNNFNKMSNLRSLNISCNRLTSIENSSFDDLLALEELNLSNNKLNQLLKSWFAHNNNIHSLDVSHNIIHRIEPGTFEGKSVTYFKVHNNNVTGSLEKGTFQGIDVEELDLSGAFISELGPDLFDKSNRNLQFLNFSSNSILKIHKTTFSTLEFLSTLDLSQNKLQDIEFDMTKLKNLSTLYINDNSIRKITRNIFSNLTLKDIQLSNNDINEIDVLSFGNLSDLESLGLKSNPLPTNIAPQMFSGLTSCTELDLTYTKIATLHNNAFSGMNSLNTFNISYGDLKVLEFEVFNDTGFISNLDFSHNQIENFLINNSNIKLVTVINLGYNGLLHITNKTFSGLNKLLILNLEHNNIINVESGAFRSLNDLVSLDLSYNRNVLFNSSVFYNMTSLQFLYLNNVLTPFHLDNAVNTSITNLDISSCGISDIYGVLMYQIKTIERLKLSSNKIRSIDKFSFDKLEGLTWIDLSNNLITKIQPSSFSHCERLQILMLNNNFLSSLQFGVFDGLNSLHSIDLSNNTLHTLKANIFHSAPQVQVVYIDNNLISEINLYEFVSANIKTVSLGGNTVPCTDLTEYKKEIYDFTITAKVRKHDTENVNGITCKSSAKLENSTQIHANNTFLTAELLNAIEEFKVTVERILNRNESKVDIDTSGFENITTSLKRFEDNYNKSEAIKNVSLEQLMRTSNTSSWYLKNILDTVKERVFNVLNDPKSNDPKSNSSIKYEDIKRTVQDMFEMQKDSLKTEFKSMFDEWMSRNVGGAGNHFEPQVAEGSGAANVKSALYFIATCLTALLCVIVLVFAYIYYKLRRNKFHTDLYSSRQPISNVMEME